MSAQAAGSAQELRRWLHERIRARGPIPFAEFMQAALYHPAHGYYCRPETTTGPEGDFYTSPDVHPAFGLLISRQIAEIAERARPGAQSPIRIIEAGPGRGRLARDIIDGLARERPDLARRTTYTLVEIGSGLRERQRRTLADRHGTIAGIEWATWPQLLEERREGPLTACVVANEFLDALPVHRIERRGGRILEIHVASDREGFREELLEPSTGEILLHLEALEREGVRLEEGQRAEIGLRALSWVGSLARLFGAEGRGGAILIDYGHPARELYGPSRRDGTLMCYRRHRVLEDPLSSVGEQDMTAHVDFTSVARRAAAAGFDTGPLVTQMRFLVALGLARMMADNAGGEQSVGRLRERLALHSLMAPGGMGDIFKVLLLARGAEASRLTGAKDPFRETDTVRKRA